MAEGSDAKKAPVSLGSEDPIVIMGAGLAGSLLACLLSQRGHRVEIFERRDDMRKSQMSAGRSINLALSVRGLTALKKVGLVENIMEIAIPMRGRMMHDREGNLTFQQYSKDEKSAIYSVSRGELNCRFMTLAEKREGVNIHFNHKCKGVDLDAGVASMVDETSHKEFKVKAQTILGCDGAFSKVRSSMMRMNRFNYSQEFLEHGYKELTIPPGENGVHKIDKNSLHIWPRGSFMMIALPNLDGSFTVTCFFPFGGENGFDRLDAAPDSEVLSFFKENFSDSVPLMPDLIKDWRENPTSSLVTVKCFPWVYKDKSCLFGDGCHAIVPFFGQGMNAAFEDCSVFDSCMEEMDADWSAVFAKYQGLRKENADAIAQMALENFIEMRDKVADPQFLLKKKVQHLLGNEFPGRFFSRYEMVSFSNIPYKEAVRIGELGDRVTDELIQDCEGDLDKINLEKAKELIDKHLPEGIYTPGSNML